jgi:hypothetical protein
VYWLAFGKYWGSAVSENCHLEEDNDKGEVWVRKTVLHLWMFTHEMWEQQNSVLHNKQLESSRRMREADINNAITMWTQRLIPIQQRTHGILISHWQSGYASH